MATYDLFIFAGHGEGDPGACGNNYQEHERCVALCKKIVTLLESKGLSVHYGIQNYKNNLVQGNTYRQKFGFSIHLNSASAAAKGIEILVPLSDKNLSIETEIINEMVKLGFTSRGLKSRDYDGTWYNRKDGVALSGSEYYGEISRAKAAGVSLGIIESCFISNLDDITRYNNNIDKIATIYANAILRYCGKSLVNTGSSSSNSGSNSNSGTSSSSETYRVRKSWDDAASQKGAYSKLDNAKAECNKHSGYSVFNSKGVAVYTNAPQSVGSSYKEDGVFHFNTRVKIRTAPSISASTDTGICYENGESVTYHTVHLNKEGYNWIQYTRGNGTQGYCAIRDLASGEKFGYAV